MEVEEVEEICGFPFEETAKRCHEVSLKIVKSGYFDYSRVARGAAKGVGSQHSWVVVGRDCYDEDTPLVDPVIWSYRDDLPREVWSGTLRDGIHQPHGMGSIWNYGRPPPPVEAVIPLAAELSEDAKVFMTMAAPEGLDHDGWALLAHAPVWGWPAKEIFTAMAQQRQLKVLIPIDTLGMVTDLNPNGLYLNG